MLGRPILSPPSGKFCCEFVYVASFIPFSM
jgi:hypothetical protein